MIKYILNLIVITVVVFILSEVISGIEIDSIKVAFFVAIILGIINIFLKPLLVILTLPINILSLGLFTFIINALLVMLAGWIVGGFSVDGFISAFIFALALSIVHFILNKIGKK